MSPSRAVVGICAVLWAGHVLAQGVPDAVDRCLQDQSLAERDLAPCIDQATRIDEQRMNMLVQQLLRDGNAIYRRELRAAQTAWRQYRNTHCGLIATDPVGGQLRHLYAAICAFERTRARIAELENPIPDRPR